MSDATERLLSALREFGGEAVRDVWLFDQWAYERLYARGNVAAHLEELDPEKFIDNERYGYVTRDTYEALYRGSYGYTVRGFADFEQFRTFLVDAESRVGLFAGFDRREGGYDFGALAERIDRIASEYPVDEFTPARDVD